LIPGGLFDENHAAAYSAIRINTESRFAKILQVGIVWLQPVGPRDSYEAFFKLR
jgi:hypothetical protein